MCLLVSHDTRYVENIFVSKIGKNALSIDGFLKIQPVSFIDLVLFYNTEDTSKCMDLYALLGGNIAFYNYFDINKSIKENIIKTFLNTDSVFRRAGNDVASALAQQKQRISDRGHAGRKGNSGLPTVQRRNPVFKDPAGRIADAGIDSSAFRPCPQPPGPVDIVKIKAAVW